MATPGGAPVLNRPLSDEEKKKLVAETKLLALDVKLREAELERGLSEDKHNTAMARLELAQEKLNVRLAEDDAATSAMARAKLEETERERKATNKYQRIYMFDSAVTDQSVTAAISTLDTWRRLDPGCDITLRIYSPGGDVISGMYFFDYIKGLQRDGHKVTTEAYGYAASMGGILLQAGDVRKVGRESFILIHEISFGVRGKVGEVEDEMEFIAKIGNRVLDIFAARAADAAKAGTASEPLSRAQFKRRWSRKDWWLTSDEAFRWGVVDAVL